MNDIAAFQFDIKSLSEAGQIEGLAAAFGNVDLGGDRIMPGAFTKTLAGMAGPILMLLHHKPDRPIGRWDSLAETPAGLVAKGRITLEASDGREAYALARDGALRGLSIGYRKVHATLGERGVRNLTELALHEVSLVSVPMNPRARLSNIKSVAGAGDIEELLRDAGLSGRKAKAAASAAWRAIDGNIQDDPTERKLVELLQNANAGLARFLGNK